MKVKLVFEKSFTENRGLVSDSFTHEFEVEPPAHIEMAHLVAAVTYDPRKDRNALANDQQAVIWDYQDEQRIVGKLLTLIDATYADREQREAQKSIMKETLYGYFNDMRTRTRQILDAVKEQ